MTNQTPQNEIEELKRINAEIMQTCSQKRKADLFKHKNKLLKRIQKKTVTQ